MEFLPPLMREIVQPFHMTCPVCLCLFTTRPSNGTISYDASTRFLLSSIISTDATATFPSVPFEFSVLCTSESCNAFPSTVSGTMWHVCLACNYKSPKLRYMTQHKTREMHVRKLKRYSIEYLARETRESTAMNNQEEECMNEISMQCQQDSSMLEFSFDDQVVDDDSQTFGDALEGVGDPKISAEDKDWIVSVAGPRHDGAVSLDELKNCFPAGSSAPHFFYYESLHPMKGANYLTATAFEQNPAEVSDNEAIFALEVSQLVSGLSGSEQRLFAKILFQVSNAHNEELTIFRKTRPPTSMTDIENMFVKGKNAILRNLPHPIVNKSEDESHAYVNIVDVLANMLAQATTMERFDDETTTPSSISTIINGHDFPPSVSSTVAALNLYLELKEDVLASDGSFILYIWIREWSDDFDPSHTKSNRCQVWLKTFTFCPPASSTDDRNTAFIAIGSKGEDHEIIEKLLTSQLRELGQGNGKKMYHGGLNCFIQVKAGIVTTCVDRPERTKLFQIGDHNGTFSLCWSFAAHVDGSQKVNCLPSCPFCRKKRLLSYMGGDGGEQQVPNITMGDLSTSNDSASDMDSLSLESRKDKNEGTSGNNSDSEFDSASSQEHSEDNNSLSTELQAAGRRGERGARKVGSAGVVPAAGACPFGKCSSWNLLDGAYSFLAPPNFPTTYDNRPDAPTAPPGREILPIFAVGQKRKLVSVCLTVDWLQQATVFAYHNYKTCPPNQPPKKRYWRKVNLEDFLRTCGIVKKLQQEIAHCAQNNLPCPIPTLWTRSKDALRRCHYAPMHMIFLGHVKSNFHMEEKWLKRYGLLTDFGKQANTVLKIVQKLRLRRFNAQPLSTSSFGPGSWVSENYLFWARASKYFFTLPAIQNCRQSTAANNAVFLSERRVAQRFVVAAVACICRIMSDNRSSNGMSDIIKIYLDTMVEMDDVLLNSTSTGDLVPCDEEAEGGDNGDDQIFGDGNPNGDINGGSMARGEKQTKRKKKTHYGKLKPNFVKSNSLGLIAAAEAHDYFGPAILNWEGGFTGERKIQDVKPLLGIRRSNTDWESIVLTRLYQQETIDWIVSRYVDENASKTQSRVIEGLYSIFRNRETAIGAVLRNEPLSALILKGDVWLAYRPTGENHFNASIVKTRSSVNLLKVRFDHAASGEEIGGCWMEPIAAGKEEEDVVNFGSIEMLENAVKQHVLMLPAMKIGQHRNTLKFVNLYYCIGDKWTERDSSGQFVSYAINSEIFEDWDLPFV